METKITGLTEAEAEERRRQEQDGAPRRSITKSTGQIVRQNVFTLFNLLNFSIAALLLFARAYSNMLFIAIILLNTVIGIAQEMKAKKLVDELSLLNRPQVTVLRDGNEKDVSAEDDVFPAYPDDNNRGNKKLRAIYRAAHFYLCDHGDRDVPGSLAVSGSFENHDAFAWDSCAYGVDFWNEPCDIDSCFQGKIDGGNINKKYLGVCRKQ